MKQANGGELLQPNVFAGDLDHLDDVVVRLCGARESLGAPWSRNLRNKVLPSRDAVVEVVEALRQVLFPGYFGDPDLTPQNVCYQVGATLARATRILQQQMERGLCFACDFHRELCSECRTQSLEKVRALVDRLPAIQQLLYADALAIYNGDPAAQSPDEAIFCYPGFDALVCHRIAHELYRLGVPLLARMVHEYAHGITGIDINPGAEIGPGLCIDHGTGVVIGETCIIGQRVRIYQGVTLGAKSFPLDEHGHPIKGIARHPIVEDDVIIYAGATILGRITIGRGAMIGGNVWLTRDVPPGAVVTQANAGETRKSDA